MLNLLFISDSPKVEFIKTDLQPFLKVIIDVVTDFDHGLKDVFEKRPATVCIQDHIGGVTGESVARHIQMLLGNSAPTFILLHSGNGKAKAIKGLYEHLIDLSQPDDTLLEDIINTLKTLLGDQWEKVYVPPKMSPSSVRSSVAVPEESREDADKLVDDFLSDLETSGFSVVQDSSPFAIPTPETTATTPPDRNSAATAPQPSNAAELPVPGVVQTNSDELAELLSPAAAPAGSKTIKKIKQIDEKPVETPKYLEPPLPVTPVTQAAEFRISQKSFPDDEPLPADLLLAFEENYRSDSPFIRRNFVIALVCIVFACGGWYLFTKKPQLVGALKQRLTALTGSKQVQVAPPVSAPVQNVIQPPAVLPAVVKSLPAFVPKDGLDSSYSVKNPGWERYVGKDAEFRLFTAAGRIQAIQVLSVKGVPVTKKLVRTVLNEFVGNSEYTITSRSIKSGVNVENGKTAKNGDVLFYKKNGAIKAFVVSVN